jgi:arginyl-tRNA--protein-N-Asp/Glu arginylyltransferase
VSASSSHKAQASHLLLYATPEHECSYLPDREAITVFADPEYPKDVALQGMLTEKGFRRSGTHVYRPNCPSCNACEAARVSVMAFKPNRSQRRTWQRNLDLDVSVGHQRFEQEHYDLYAHYVTTRHAGGGMDDPTPDKYQDFLFCSWAETRLIEFRCEEQLLAVAVTDQLPGALSAVYTFFDPEHAARGLGVYAVLWQIETARRTGLDWLYLGFAIDDCAKMRYKRDFGPQQRLRDEQWADT